VDNTGNTTLNDGTIVAADMMQINHYYPFGMNMEGNWNGLNGKNKYQYNEKELNSDFGLDLSDYGARFYDAAIGRFPSVDPLSPVYARQTPYAYAANNPATMIDYMGMGPAGQGADGKTNEQWVNASNPAGKGSEAASSAYRGSETGKANYEKSKAGAEQRAATSHIAASYVLQEFGHFMRNSRTGERSPNVVEGYNLVQQQPGGELSQHADEARSITDFARENNGIHRTNLINQRDRVTLRPGGPLMRYVFDPLNANVVIDMRHMLVVGNWGTNAGTAVEAFQTITFNDSGWNEQDFYSNALGSGFYHYLESLQRRGDIPLTCGNCAFLRGADFVNRLQIFMNSTELRNKFVPQDDTYNQVNRR
jgi:RHS repeat-associated protein